MRIQTAAAALGLLLLSACSSLDYDLGSLTYPVSAAPAPAGSQTEPFSIKAKSVLWVHGLAGESQPDVAAAIDELEPGAMGIANLRVSQGAGFHDWLLTHLSLSLVRLKTVRIEGELVR